MFRKFACIIVVIAILSIVALASFVPAVGQGYAGAPKTGIITCYLRDSQLSSFSFETGTYGRSHRNGDVVTAATNLDTGFLYKGYFTVGCLGDDVGRIFDLGDKMIEDGGVGNKHGIAEVRGKKYSVFHSLRFDQGKLQHKFAPYTERWQLLLDTGELFLPGVKHARSKIRNGNIYLMRVTDRRGKEKFLGKLRVLEYYPGDHVTFTWGRLR